MVSGIRSLRWEPSWEPFSVDTCGRLWTPVESKACRSGLCGRLWTPLVDLRIRKVGDSSSPGRATEARGCKGFHVRALGRWKLTGRPLGAIRLSDHVDSGNPPGTRPAQYVSDWACVDSCSPCPGSGCRLRGRPDREAAPELDNSNGHSKWASATLDERAVSAPEVRGGKNVGS